MKEKSLSFLNEKWSLNHSFWDKEYKVDTKRGKPRFQILQMLNYGTQQHLGKSL